MLQLRKEDLWGEDLGDLSILDLLILLCRPQKELLVGEVEAWEDTLSVVDMLPFLISGYLTPA